MNSAGKCMEIFYRIIEAMEIADELGNDEIFNVLKEAGDKIADILDIGGNQNE